MYRDNTRKQRRNLLLATLAVAVLFGADGFSGGTLRNIVRLAGNAVLSEAHAALTRIGSSGFFATRAGLARENQALKEQLATLEARLPALEVRESRMEELEQAAHLASEAPGTTAPILSRPAASPYSTFSIGAGEGEGLERGARVLSTNGFVLGHIIDTAAHEALVEELFAAGKQIEAQIDGRAITLEGKGGGNALGELPRGVPVAIGTAVFARGEASHAIGLVGHVEGEPSSASVKVYVRTPINLQTLSLVFVAS